MPSTLSLLAATCSARSGKAAGRRGRLGLGLQAGSALGPVVGGVLLEHFWWGSVFLINVPIVVVALIGLPLLVPERVTPRRAASICSSAALTLLTVLPVVYAIKTFAHGDELKALPFLVVGLLFGYVFVRRQRTLADPLIDISLFRIRTFSAAIVTNVLVVFVMAGSLFFIPQFLQLSEGLSPLRGGLLLLPGAALSVASGFFAAAAAQRAGLRRLVAGGLATAALGYAVMTALPLGHGVAVITVAFCLISLGAGTVMTLTNSIVLSTVPPERAGAASAVSETGIELGGALGVAVLGSVLSSAYRVGLDPVEGVSSEVMGSARETFANALRQAAETGGAAGRSLAGAARDAFAGVYSSPGSSARACLLSRRRRRGCCCGPVARRMTEPTGATVPTPMAVPPPMRVRCRYRPSAWFYSPVDFKGTGQPTHSSREDTVGVSLAKGGNVSLSKEAPGLTAVLVGLGWDVRTTTGADYDLDASALLLRRGRQGRLRPALRLLQQPHQPRRSVRAHRRQPHR